MKVRAKISFGGLVSMTQGQETDLPKDAVLDDLLEAGYVDPVEEEEQQEQEAAGESGETDLLTGYLDKEQLEEMTVADLRRLARQLGLSDSGKKAELIERIAAKEVFAEKEESKPETEGGAA